MAEEFRGFEPAPATGLHRTLVVLDQCRRFTDAIVRRLGPRLVRPVAHSGRDTRGGRDYFYDQTEFYVRGRPDPCFIGFFHYGEHTEQPGSYFEAWESERDSEPVFRLELAALQADVQVAWDSGRLSDLLDTHAQAIRRELGM